ncbi:F-box protein, partial [Trifolium medium]|nr:F-box protein [Trifolium medium]
MNPETVLAVTCHGEKPLALGTLCYLTPRPVLFRGRDERWVPFFNMPTVGGDICVFKGRFYTVDIHGKTVSVGADSSVQLAAEDLVHTHSTHLGR